MRIVTSCPKCGRRYEVASRLAGKRVRCKECLENFRVPAPVTLARKPSKEEAAPSSFDDLDDIDAEPVATIAPAPKGPRRPTGVLIVATLCVLLIGGAIAFFLMGEPPAP